MLMPAIFGETFFDNFFNSSFNNSFDNPYTANGLMSTDIQESDQGYMLTMDMPGMKKEDVQAELKDGYLTIQAASGTCNDQKDDHGNYIRRERCYGSCSRSFYVGDNITQEDIKAKFEDGTLKLLIPKREPEETVEQKKYIAIEG